MVFMGGAAYPAAVRPLRIVLIWIALMSGIFSLCREFYFAYLGANGRIVSPNNVLAAWGHLAMASFVLSGFGVWFLEHQRVKELETQLQKKPIYRARDAILILEKRGHKMREKIEQNRWWFPMGPRIRKLRSQFTHVLETYMQPSERIELLNLPKDEFERAKFMLDFTPNQLALWDSLTPLLTAMDRATRRIDMMKA